MLVRSAPRSLGRFLCGGGALDFTDNPIACQENYNSTNRPSKTLFFYHIVVSMLGIGRVSCPSPSAARMLVGTIRMWCGFQS